MNASAWAGTAALIRFQLRRDRVRVAVWIAAIVLLVVVSAASTKGLYPTQADLDKAAAASLDNPAALALNGPAQALDTMGGQVAFQAGAVGLTVVGLMSVLMVTRLTRAEEESGRLELVRSMAVGRHAPLVAALLLVAGMNLLTGALVALSLAGMDLPLGGSIVFGASFTAVGVLFAAVDAVTSQVTENSRVASGLAGAVLGASFALRAVGDVGGGTASWFSPIGLAQKARPYAGERWWPLALALVVTAALTAVAAALASGRDFGAGLVGSRPGRSHGSAALGRPIGLAIRLQRGTVSWWSVAAFLTGVAYGSIADSIDQFVDSDAIKEILASARGASLTDSYLARSLVVLGLLAAGFSLQSALRLRSEETAQRTQALVAGGTSRRHWVVGHLLVAAGGAVVVLAAGGLGTGLSYGIAAGDGGQVLRLTVAAIAYAPAVWIVAGVAIALFGLAPRWVSASWAVLAASFVVALFGTLLDLPSWLADLSPFEHIPQVPAVGLTTGPLLALAAIAVALVWSGLAGFQRRDIGA